MKIIKKQVGKIKSERSYWKYCIVYNHLEEFMKNRYKVSDIALKELAPAFITDFELFLRTGKNHCTNTVWSYMMPFRSIIFMSINNGWLGRDPFYGYTITKEETKRGFLTKEEIKLLINGTFKKKSYELIRDLFIFCRFTFLALINKHQFISKLKRNSKTIGNDLETIRIRGYAFVFTSQITYHKIILLSNKKH